MTARSASQNSATEAELSDKALVVVSQPNVPVIPAGPVLTVRGTALTVNSKRKFIAPDPPPPPVQRPSLKRKRSPPRRPADLSSISRHFLMAIRSSDRCPAVRPAALSTRHIQQLKELARPNQRRRSMSREAQSNANASGHVLMTSPKKTNTLARSTSLTVVAQDKGKGKERAGKRRRKSDSESSSEESTDSDPDYDPRWNEIDCYSEVQWHRAPSEDREYVYTSTSTKPKTASRGAKPGPDKGARNELCSYRRPILARSIIDPFLAKSTLAVLAPDQQVSLKMEEAVEEPNPIGFDKLAQHLKFEYASSSSSNDAHVRPPKSKSSRSAFVDKPSWVIDAIEREERSQLAIPQANTERLSSKASDDGSVVL